MYYGPMMIDIEGTALTAKDAALLTHPRVGGVLLFSRNYIDRATLLALITDIRSAIKGKPLLIAVDHEGGRVWRFKEEFTKLPAAGIYGLKFKENPEACLRMAKEMAFIMASELLSVGIDLSLAPVLDIDRGISSIIGDRSFNADPEILIPLARAFVAGMNAAGMQATGKHFPGHGGIVEDSHIASPVDKRPYAEISASDLLPFKTLIAESSLGAIMPAHITFPSIDSVPAGFSKRWLQDILRTELRFKGAVISDCLSMEGAALGGDFVVRARLAIDAGCDMVILAQQTRETLEWVLENLNRDTSQSTNERLAVLAGKTNKTSKSESKSESKNGSKNGSESEKAGSKPVANFANN